MKTLKKNIATLMAGILLSALIPCYLPEDVSGGHHNISHISLSDVLINAIKTATSTEKSPHQLANLISTIQMAAELKPILRASNDNHLVTHGELLFIISNYDSFHTPACFRLQKDPLRTYASYILPPKTPPPLC